MPAQCLPLEKFCVFGAVDVVCYYKLLEPTAKQTFNLGRTGSSSCGALRTGLVLEVQYIYQSSGYPFLGFSNFTISIAF